MHTLKRYELLAKSLVDFRSGRFKGRVLPLRYWIEPTNKCNLRCPLCPQSADKKTKRGFMDYTLYRQIIDEIKHYGYDVNLSHRGESLFHPQLFDFISYANKNGLKTRIHSNGTILTPELDRAIIESGLDFLSFSFDGFTKEEYEASRVGAQFEATLGAISDFLSIKARLNSEKPFTVLQVIKPVHADEMRFNQQKEQFMAYFKNLPLDKLYVKEPHNWGGLIEPSGSDNSNAGHYVPCTFCWYSLTILWDGTVVPCPQDFFGTLKMGNVNHQKIGEIWRNQPFQRLRLRFVNQDVQNLNPCATCDRIHRQHLFGIPLSNVKEFLSENIVGYDLLKHLYHNQLKRLGLR